MFSSSLRPFEDFLLGSFNTFFLAIFLKKKWPKLNTSYFSDCIRNLDLAIRGDFLLVRGFQKEKCPIQEVINKLEADPLCIISMAAMSVA